MSTLAPVVGDDLADHLAAGADDCRGSSTCRSASSRCAAHGPTARCGLSPSALAISPRMCARPSLAWSSATCDDLFGDAGDLDVHLHRGDAFGRAGDLEVHVAEVILVTQDVGEDREILAFEDQAHGDAAKPDA